MNIAVLRPRAFIPHWDKSVYADFVEWAAWHWGGAVHIKDVLQATNLAVNFVASSTKQKHLVATVDGAYDYTDDDLDNWDASGSGSTFNNYYSQYQDLAIKYQLDPSAKPRKIADSNAYEILGMPLSMECKIF
jgi:hypothetical protein